jgi:hypothetical protein
MKRIRFSLRFLFVLLTAVVFAVGLVLTPYVRMLSMANDQRRIANEIEAIGGSVGFSYPFLESDSLWTSLWIALAGPHRIVKVSFIDFDGRDIADDGLVILRQASDAEALDLSNTNVNDASLNHLEGLSRLRVIDVRETDVTAIGIARLQKMLPDTKIYWGTGKGDAAAP